MSGELLLLFTAQVALELRLKNATDLWHTQRNAAPTTKTSAVHRGSDLILAFVSLRMWNKRLVLVLICTPLVSAFVGSRCCSHDAFSPAVRQHRGHPVPPFVIASLAETSAPSPRRSTTQISLFPPMSSWYEWTRAASSLGLATAVGKMAHSSILVTLTAAAVLSNLLGWAPLVHPLYETCWDYFLPGSLVLLLFSLSSHTAKDPVKYTATPLTFIRRMAFPFGLASLASVVGCSIALFVSRIFHPILLPPTQALEALSCLVASFIGGSVNFMATARLIGSSSAVLSAMAAADLFVMAVYFGVLGIAANSTRLKQWITGQTVNGDALIVDSKNDQPAKLSNTTPNKMSLWQRTKGSVLALSISAVLVEFANYCERRINHVVPGTACAVLALVTPLIRQLIPTAALAVAPFWSELSFLALFAAIGLTANVGSALRAGPGCLLLSLLALVVHVLVVLGGTAVWNRTVECRRSVDLETILIASNAAIGGPATAAAWAGQRAPQWALAATVWGVVGYATGTTFGVWFYQAAGQWLAF